MARIIETNLSLSWDDQIKDHQSRIIEAESWEEYISAFESYDGEKVEFKTLTSMTGSSIPRECQIRFLRYDAFHMSCQIEHGSGLLTKRLAYLVEE